MATAGTALSTQRDPELLGQTVIVIGGSAGIGLETARRARAEGAGVVLTGRNSERLKQAALELDARCISAFDANDPASLQSFFQNLPTPIDHVMVTAGAPHYGPPLEMPTERPDAASPSTCCSHSRSHVASPTRSGRPAS
jgi:NAD(P)-dependent dehydrogenase (short-subunit alcohol dehydrogenase family)